MTSARIALLCALSLGFGLSACGGGMSAGDAVPSWLAGRSAPVTTLSVPTLTSTWIDHPTAVAAAAKDKSGATVSGASLAWTSADPSIATVDTGGIVTPLRAGFTTLTARTDGVSASGRLSVRGLPSLPVRSQSVGTNLSGISYYSSQFPFADMMKSGSGWNSLDDKGVWGAAFPSMTSDGYPAALGPGQHALSAVAWSGSQMQAGRYVVLWDGDGSISFPLSNVTIAESSANRIAIDVTDTSGPLWVGIDRTNPANPVHNLRFLWPGTEATYATQPFNPLYLSRIAPFSLLRFMDWGATNGSPVVEWADRAHVSDVSYGTPAGVPIEVMIDLANTLHVDPWFCIPHQASDDYVTQFATLLHNRLDPALHPHIEYSNEVWNFRLRANDLGQRPVTGARPRQPLRPASDLLCDAGGADLQDHAGRVGAGRQRPHHAGPRQAGCLEQFPERHARLQGHRSERRRHGDRAVLRRCQRRRRVAGRHQPDADERLQGLSTRCSPACAATSSRG